MKRSYTLYSLFLGCMLLWTGGCTPYVVGENEDDNEVNKEDTSSPSYQEGQEDLTVASDTIYTTGELPTEESIWGGKFLVWKVVPHKENEIRATLITLEQGQRTAEMAMDILSQFTVGTIKGWRLFTEAEAKEFRDTHRSENLTDLNHFLMEHGKDPFKHDSGLRQRYLCADGTKTFSFYNTTISKAGTKTKYYYRAVKTVCIIRQ